MKAPGRKWRFVDWEYIRWALMHGEHHYRPWEIDRMGLDDLRLALRFPDGKRRPPSGMQDLGGVGVVEHARRFRALTPAQRLGEALARRT